MPRFALAAALLAVGTAYAGTLEGVTLPDAQDVGGHELVLNGMGLREATFLRVDVYVAGLYLPAKTADPATILAATEPKRLVMSFVRNLGKGKLAGAWTEGFEKNSGAAAAEVGPGLASLNGSMEDVKKGDTIVLTYIPDAGTTVTVKGKDAVTIPGEAFQRVLFSIWLGPHPPNAGLREGLLGGTESR